MRLVCTPLILAGTSLEGGVTSPMRRIPEVCNWRLTVFTRDYAASDEEGLPQILSFLLRTKRMVTIGPDLGLLLVSLFHMMKIVTTSGGVRVCNIKV